MIRSILNHTQHFSKFHLTRRLCAQLLSPSAPNDNSKSYPPHIVDIVDKIASLTLLEVSDLNALLQKKLNIQATQMMMPAFQSQVKSEDDEAPPKEEKVQEKTLFNIKLISFDSTKKVALIKEIKTIFPEMNLVQAKKFVEGVPDYIRKDVSKEEAEKIKAACEGVGGVVLVE